MRLGRTSGDEAGHKIFDLLLQHGADPYLYSRQINLPLLKKAKAKFIHKKFDYQCPLTVGITNGNSKMVAYYLSRISDFKRFQRISHVTKETVELWAATKGMVDIIEAML